MRNAWDAELKSLTPNAIVIGLPAEVAGHGIVIYTMNLEITTVGIVIMILTKVSMTGSAVKTQRAKEMK